MTTWFNVISFHLIDRPRYGICLGGPWIREWLVHRANQLSQPSLNWMFFDWQSSHIKWSFLYVLVCLHVIEPWLSAARTIPKLLLFVLVLAQSFCDCSHYPHWDNTLHNDYCTLWSTALFQAGTCKTVSVPLWFYAWSKTYTICTKLQASWIPTLKKNHFNWSVRKCFIN